MKARIEYCKRRLVAEVTERNRLATDEEIAKLCSHFEDSRGTIPMAEIVRY